MKPAAFEYVRAGSVGEAVEALGTEDAKIIAGGQSLVPMMNFRLAQPDVLVDINGIADLGTIEETAAHIRFGALVRHVAALNCPVTREALPIIGEAMRHVAHLAIRNRGTIGGSLVHADPSAEWPLLVTLLDGEIEIQGPSGTRTATPTDFFDAPLVVNLEEDEILVAVKLPKFEGQVGMAFDEVAQRAGDFAIVAAGACIRIDGNKIAEARIALGGVADTAVRAHVAEDALTGAAIGDDAIADAASLATDGLDPASDLHASAEYRLQLVPVLVRRVLQAAAERAGAA